MGSYVLDRSGKSIHMGVGRSLRQLWRTPHQLSVAENCNTHRNSPSETAERHHNEICGSFVSTVCVWTCNAVVSLQADTNANIITPL